MHSSKAYPYKKSSKEKKFAVRYFFASILEYFIWILPLPPKIILFLHQLRGVRFIDRSSVFIRPLVQLSPRFPEDLTIGKNVFIDLAAMILPDRFLPEKQEHCFERTKIVIEDNVYVGMGAMILSGVTLHTGAVVSSGSVVYEDVPAHSIVRGNPARVVKTLPVIDRSMDSASISAEQLESDDGYDENGLSRKAYPYQQRFFKTLFSNPGVIIRSFLTYTILILPVPPRLATAIYSWMGVKFKDVKTSGLVIPIFLDPINPKGITFGKYSHASCFTIIAAHFFDPYHPGFYYRKGKVTIEDNVFIGMNVINGAPASVGDYSVLSANSVIFRDVKNNFGIIGNPGRALTRLPSKTRDYELTIDKDEKFYDNSGKSVDIFHFEHRLGKLLKEDPMRVFNFLLDYMTLILPIPSFAKATIHRFWGIKIKDPSSIYIGRSLHLERLAPENVSIGSNVTLEDRVKILAHYPESTVEGCYYRTGKVTIEDDVFIGANSMVANNITIGKGAVIMPGTLLVSDVPPQTIVGGFPTEVIGKRDL